MTELLLGSEYNDGLSCPLVAEVEGSWNRMGKYMTGLSRCQWAVSLRVGLVGPLSPARA